MKFAPGFRAKRRLITTFLLALGFVGPMFATPRLAQADSGDLENDARMEGYMGAKTVLEGGVATSYLLIAAMTLLAGGVMFKDARRIHKKS